MSYGNGYCISGRAPVFCSVSSDLAAHLDAEHRAEHRAKWEARKSAKRAARPFSEAA